MQTFVKSAICGLIRTDIEDLYHLADRYKTISFDVFDTLLERNVRHSDDVLRYMSPEASRLVLSSPDLFFRRRQACEIEAAKKCYPREATIEEIYRLYPNVNDATQKRLIELERKAELRLADACQQMVDLFNRLASSGKRLILISDTPLSDSDIADLVNSIGVRNYSAIYTSSSYGHKKREGSLFDYVLDAEDIKPKELLHIGNSLMSDYVNPKRRGISSVLISNETRRKGQLIRGASEMRSATLGSSIIDKVILNHERPGFDPYMRIGYEVLGPLLLTFCIWLKRGLDSCYPDYAPLFLAREGVVLEKAFQKLFPGKLHGDSVIRVSRRSTVACRLSAVDTIDDLAALLRTFSVDGISIKELVDLGYLTEKDAAEFCSTNGCRDNENLLIANDDVRHAFGDTILPLVRAYSNTQRALFLSYIREKIRDYRSVAFVDVGWRGTMQDMITPLISGYLSSAPQGFYFGVENDPRTLKSTVENKHGAIFEDDGGFGDDLCVIDLTGQVFEMLFMDTNFGTTLRYGYSKGRAYPILDQSEYTGEIAEKVRSIQNAAFTFLDDYKQTNVCVPYTEQFLLPSDAFERYKALAVNPSNRVLNLFRGFETKDVSISGLLSKKSGLYWLFHLKGFAKEFKNNHCKALYLKSVFPLPLPYYQLLRWLKKRSMTVSKAEDSARRPM